MPKVKPSSLRDLPMLDKLPKRLQMPNPSNRPRGKTVSSVDGMLRIPPRVLLALGYMAFDGMRRPDAASLAEMSDLTLRRYLRSPMVLRELKAMVKDVLEGEVPQTIAALVKVRDGEDSPKNAIINASKVLLAAANPEPSKAPSITFNGGVTVRAGYIVNVGAHSDAARLILQQAGSSKNIIEHQADELVVHGEPSPSKAIEHG